MGSKENVGHCSIGKGTGHENPFPRVLRWGRGPLLPIFGNESLNQLKGSFPMDRITGQLVRVGDCTGSPFTGCFDSRPPVIRGGQVFGFNGLHVFNGHQLPAEPTGFYPMDPPENSSFNEMRCTGAVGRYPHVFYSVAGSGAELTHSAWGSIAIGSAKGFANGSFGTHAESTPPE
jgi:hypothetical protein